MILINIVTFMRLIIKKTIYNFIYYYIKWVPTIGLMIAQPILYLLRKIVFMDHIKVWNKDISHQIKKFNLYI
jgi:hypothetical protein